VRERARILPGWDVGLGDTRVVSGPRRRIVARHCPLSAQREPCWARATLPNVAKCALVPEAVPWILVLGPPVEEQQLEAGRLVLTNEVIRHPLILSIKLQDIPIELVEILPTIFGLLLREDDPHGVVGLRFRRMEDAISDRSPPFDPKSIC